MDKNAKFNKNKSLDSFETLKALTEECQETLNQALKKSRWLEDHLKTEDPLLKTKEITSHLHDLRNSLELLFEQFLPESRAIKSFENENSNEHPIEKVQPKKQNRILLVEDQPFAAQIAKMVLSDLDCSVDIAHNAQDAILKAKEAEYDLIFMDIGLPDLSGAEATKQIQQNKPNKNKHLPIVALTAGADHQEQEACIQSGMDAILVKPLFKEKALTILSTFIPKEAPTIPDAANDLIHWGALPEKVIDLKLSARFFKGNTRLAKNMIKTMIANFYNELEELNKAYQTENWETVQNIIHKLRGGISYCGTPRLEEACIQLEKHLRSGDNQFARSLHLQLLNEIEKVKSSVEKI